jgi:hypothetical protein
MDQPINNPATLKARKLRRIVLVRGRHLWHFVCAAGEEAQLLRCALDAHEAQKSALRKVDLLILARELGVRPDVLNPPVRKAE